MKRKILSLLLCGSIVLTCFFAAIVNAEDVEEQNTVSEQGSDTKEIYTLTLQQAIDLAMEKDPDYINADVKIIDAKIQLEEAKRNRKDVQFVPMKVSQGLTSFALQRGYYVKQAEIGVESALKEKEQIKAKIAYSVTQQYYAVKLAERLTESAQSACEIAEDNLRNIQNRFSLGMVAKLDVNNATYAVNQLRSVRDKYERNLDITGRNLAASLFVDGESIFKLTDDIEYVEFSADCKADTKQAMKSRYDIYSLEAMNSQAGLLLDIAGLYGRTSAEYSSANLSKRQSDSTLEKSKNMIGILIQSAYNDILNAKDAIMLAEEKLEICNLEYEIAKMQAEIGNITNSQLTEAINNVTNAKIELDNAKLTYKLATEKYGYEITIGL